MHDVTLASRVWAVLFGVAFFLLLAMRPSVVLDAWDLFLPLCLGMRSSTFPADVIVFHNATFLIALGNPGQHPSLVSQSTSALFADTLAVRRGRVIHLGPLSTAQRRQILRRSISAVDLAGAFVIPGLIDSHLHLLDGGLQLQQQLSLRGVSSMKEFVERVKSATGELKPGQWLLGSGWNEALWSSTETSDTAKANGTGRRLRVLPDRSWLDAVTGSNPAYLTRMDGHTALINTAALNIVASALGIAAAADAPAAAVDAPAAATNKTLVCAEDFNSSSRCRSSGGCGSLDEGSASDAALLEAFGDEAERDAAGGLTGVLRDTAMAIVAAHIPQPSTADLRVALDRASDEALRHGVTSVVDFGRYYPGTTEREAWDDLLQVYIPADASGRLRLRVHCVTPLLTWRRTEAWVRARGERASQRLSWGTLKAFSDGSLGSHTALFHEPYADLNDAQGDFAGALDEGRSGTLSKERRGKNVLGNESRGSALGGNGVAEQREGPTSSPPPPEDMGRGLQLLDFEWLAGVVVAVQQSDVAHALRIAVHAIGDAAVDGVLGAFMKGTTEGAQESESGRGKPLKNAGGSRSIDSFEAGGTPRLRLEHAQHLTDEAVKVLNGGAGASARPINDVAAKAPAPGGSASSMDARADAAVVDVAAADAVAAIPRVAVSMQPYHMVDDARVVRSRLGAARAKATSFRLSSVDAASHAVLALGSDWPVVTLDPFEGMLASLHSYPGCCSYANDPGTRFGDGGSGDGSSKESNRSRTNDCSGDCASDFEQVFDERERLDAGQALLGYTHGAALASFGSASCVGSLQVGDFADMVVLAGDPLVALTAGIHPLVLKTYVGGLLEFQAEEK